MQGELGLGIDPGDMALFNDDFAARDERADMDERADLDANGDVDVYDALLFSNAYTAGMP